MFPDRNENNHQDWCVCCVEHDLAYWKGGERSERKLADLELKECVYSKTGNLALANVMYKSVRVGGSPYFYSPFRWGYGWNYGRYYTVLNKEELAAVRKKLQDYNKEKKGSECE